MRQQQKFRCFGDLAAVRASQGSKVLRQRFHQGRAAASSQVMAPMESKRQNIKISRVTAQGLHRSPIAGLPCLTRHLPPSLEYDRGQGGPWRPSPDAGWNCGTELFVQPIGY